MAHQMSDGLTHQMSEGLSGRRQGTVRPAGRARVATLLAVAGGAWRLSTRLAMPPMRLGVLTGATMMPARGQMGLSGAMSMGLSAFVAAWTVMMVAMMLPSVLPAAGAFDAWARGTGRSGGATTLFVIGYLLVWSATGGVAYLAVQALQTWPQAGSAAALRAGAALLVVAGVYQLTPPKRACLRQCRSPHMGVAPRATMRSQAYLGAVRAGLWQGVYCLGSSWPLMLVLVLLGMMNLAWMGVISAIIIVEKVVPSGERASKVVGWGLAAWGLILLAAPHMMPAPGL